MSDGRAKLVGDDEPVPDGYRWSDLSDPKMEGARLEDHYRETLAALGAEGGMLGLAGGPRLCGPLQCQPAVAGEQSLLGLLYPLPTQYRRCDARQAQHPRRPCPLQPRAYEAPPRARSRPGVGDHSNSPAPHRPHKYGGESMSDLPLEVPPNESDPKANGSPHDVPEASRLPNGRRWLQIGSVVILATLLAGLVWGTRGRSRVPTTAIEDESAPTTWTLSEVGTDEVLTVQGLGTLPSLDVLQHWELGEGQPMVDDVSRGLAVSIRGNDSVQLVRLGDDRPPVVVGRAPGQDMHIARLSADGRHVITFGSGGWSDKGAFLPGRAAIYNMDDASHPTKVGEIVLETDDQIFCPWRDYMLMGEARWDPTPHAGSLRVIRLMGPDAGKEVGRLEGETTQIAVEGDRAYTIRSCGGRAQPTPSVEAVPDCKPRSGRPMLPPPMIMESNPAFPDCLAVVDLSDPSRPDLIAELELPWTLYPFGFAAYGGYVYMATNREGILVADARGLGVPVLLGARIAKDMKDPMVIDSGGFLGLAVNGSVLYFGNHTTLVAFDLSTPAAPEPVAVVELGEGDFIDRMILSDNRLYVSTGDVLGAQQFGLWVIDAPGDPASLRRLSAAQ